MKTLQRLREEFNLWIHDLIETRQKPKRFEETNDMFFEWIQQQVKKAKIEVLESIELPNTQFEDPDVISYEKEIKRIMKEKLTQLEK